MQVKLLYHTPEPEKSVALAARICYSKSNGADLYDKLTDDNVSHMIDVIMSNKHYSTLEHCSFTFIVDGLSRACTHQLVRHRLASYNQQSQRYVDLSNLAKVVEPTSIASNPKASNIFNSVIEECYLVYKNLLKLGIDAEDARYVLPNACQSNIVITMNGRELLHFFKLRCCNRSQWEIRELAWEMLKLVQEVAPKLFNNAGPSCRLDGKCSEGSMSCGHSYSKTAETEK